MPSATIQGDTHGSQKDARLLVKHGFENHDQLFIEGRAPVDIRGVSTTFAIFLVGVITALWMQSVVGLISKTWSYIRHGSITNIEEKADEAGLAIEKEIDSGLYEIFKNSRVLLIGLSIFLTLFTITFFAKLIDSNILQLRLENIIFLITTLAHIIAFVLLVGGFLFGGYVIVQGPSIEERDEAMADSIIERSEENDFDSILVLCGDRHVPGISQELKDAGWEVDPNRSQNWVSRLARAINL